MTGRYRLMEAETGPHLALGKGAAACAYYPRAPCRHAATPETFRCFAGPDGAYLAAASTCRRTPFGQAAPGATDLAGRP